MRGKKRRRRDERRGGEKKGRAEVQKYDDKKRVSVVCGSMVVPTCQKDGGASSSTISATTERWYNVKMSWSVPQILQTEYSNICFHQHVILGEKHICRGFL